jgi:hypothetical protein
MDPVVVVLYVPPEIGFRIKVKIQRILYWNRGRGRGPVLVFE